MGETDTDRVPSQYGKRKESSEMLWLILGIILLVIAIAGGAIVHPILFVLGILAIVMFLAHWRGRAAY
jgi:Flp pilus assembly protein TadB